MSKRSAQGPQGDKDTNLFQFNMSSTPDDKPQRATAAQLAARKIKDVRRRPRAGTPSGSAGGSFGSPFNSIDPNTVSSPSLAQQPMTNGFNFGQSQSFPPASPTPKPPAQNGGSQFAFGSGGGGGGGGSSTFNFSASFGGTASTPVSNPFASMNTGGASQQAPASNFSGFKGNLFNVPSTGSQSPAQQPLPSGGLFGAGSQQSSSTGGLFGSSANSGPSSQSGITTPANGSIFGQSTTGASSSNIFAPSGADKPNPFAQNAAFGGDSMQTSPDAKSSHQKPSLFGSGSGGFGVSTNFGSSGAGSVFGGQSSAPAQTPSKPLFGAKPTEQTASASPSLFGASTSTQPASSTPAAPSFSSAPLTTGNASSSLFNTSTPKPATMGQNLFQPTTSLFGASTPSTAQNPSNPSEEKVKEETKANQSTSSQPSFSFSATTTGASLFSNNASAAPVQSTGPSQPVSTGSLFALKPASTEQENPKPAEGNPFSSLFVPKPAGAESSKPEQKPLPSSSSTFAPKPVSSEGVKPSEQSKTPTPASPFSAPTLGEAPSPAPQSTAFSISAPQTTSSVSAFAPPTTLQSPFKTNGVKPAITASPMSSTASSPALSFDKLQPANMPSGLDEGTREEVETVHRVRLLNACFQREVAKLDATANSFDQLIQFYLRVRETIGAPVEFAGTKPKTPGNSDHTNEPSRKAGTLGNGNSASGAASPENTTASNLFSGSQNTPSTSNKRKATGDDDSDASSPAKRVDGDSATANIFANSFSRSKTFESNKPAGTPSPKKLDAPVFKPSTPESNKPSLFSTTPKSSPPKAAFSASSAPQEFSASGATPSQPMPAFKPTFTASASGTSSTNPFVVKPSGDAGPSTSAPLSVPKFGSGGPINFLSQFKAQSDKNAEKEKEKRKAEEFDSDEDDEAEWERKDAEKQRKKREELEAQQNRRAKYVPGQGFSFENSTTEEEKSNASAASSVLDSKPNSFSSSSNIFGHLSATPSESGENEHDAADDTEEDSASGDDAAGESSSAPTEDLDASQTDSKANNTVKLPAPGSSDEDDSTKTSEKTKQADSSEQNTAEDGSSGGRSLFDRVEYQKDGKPKRQGDDGKPASSLFGSSQLASPFNSSSTSTPNPFAALSQSQAKKPDEGSTPKPSSTNIFGSPTPAGSIFGSSTSATSGASTPSIFATGSSATKPGSDNTWKPNTPIKFSSDSAPGLASSAKSETATAAAPASESSNHHPMLFGAPSAGAQPGPSGNEGTAGFSFGGPSQSGSSLLTPSVLTSESQSRASTPGVTSDTGAEDSADGDAQKPEPQVDLARSGAGEEDEDVLIETRARALKMVDGSWASQGVGFLRLLKNRTTSRSRVLVRADPSGNVVLNARLMKEVKYTVNGNNIQFLVPRAEGAPEMWALRLKAGEAPKVGTAIDENKS
ncbi:hypothetical protein BDW72DRAFT_18365 [Aspergillus terricola var. indicus]